MNKGLKFKKPNIKKLLRKSKKIIAEFGKYEETTRKVLDARGKKFFRSRKTI